MVILGIHIGGGHIRAGMVDDAGAILASRSMRTPADLDTFQIELDQAIRWLIDATEPPAGVGVGCKGVIDPESTRIDLLPGALHYLEGHRLSDLAGVSDGAPVFADNDARAALAGEMVWGAAHGLRNVMMLTLGGGVGGAVMVNGQILRGHSGGAGLLGHITLEADGARCSCGNRGCLETVFSARAIESEARAAVHRGCASSLTRLFREQPQLATCRTVFQAAAEGDAVAREIVARAIHKLAAAVAGLLHVFDPEVAIVGGPVADAGADLLGPLEEEVWERSRGLLGREVPLVEQQVADKSGIVGAAGLALATR
jgi:glucokinase